MRLRGGKEYEKISSSCTWHSNGSSMTAGVSAATVESKDDLKNATIGVQLGTTGDIEASEYEADGATVKRYSKGSESNPGTYGRSD